VGGCAHAADNRCVFVTHRLRLGRSLTALAMRPPPPHTGQSCLAATAGCAKQARAYVTQTSSKSLYHLGLSSKVSTMGGQPPSSRSIAFAFIPGKRLINLQQRLDLNAGGPCDTPRTARAIEPNDIVTDGWKRVAVGSLI
jgi:hypothetical protein